jgi:phosphoribosylformylglycinamidine cyclo-ligase
LKYLATKYPESFAAVQRFDLFRPSKIDRCSACSHIDAGQLVLSSTRTYAPIIKKILDKYTQTKYTEWCIAGGAQTKILHFREFTHYKR